MSEYIFLMTVGVLLFVAGIVFERMSRTEENADIPADVEPDCPDDGDVDPVLWEQWKKLLEYDGNKQEDNDEDR